MSQLNPREGSSAVISFPTARRSLTECTPVPPRSRTCRRIAHCDGRLADGRHRCHHRFDGPGDGGCRSMSIWSQETQIRATEIIARYPEKRSAVMPLLYLAMAEDGLSHRSGMEEVAEWVGLTPAQVHAVASFYTMYKREPTGKYLISCCTSISCMLLGGDDVMHAIEDESGVPHGETDPEGLLSVEHVECIGACGGAVAVQVNYELVEGVSPEKARELVRWLKKANPGRGQLRRDAGAVRRRAQLRLGDSRRGRSDRAVPGLPVAGNHRRARVRVDGPACRHPEDGRPSCRFSLDRPLRGDGGICPGEARAGHDPRRAGRDREGLRAPRPRWCRFLRRPEVEFPRSGPSGVPGDQRRRVGARNLQGPSAAGTGSPPDVGGDHHHLPLPTKCITLSSTSAASMRSRHAGSSSQSTRRTQRATWARESSAPTSTSKSRCTSEGAHTSAVRRRPSSTAWRVGAASRG
jgi:NADH-quinone oxidoreductase subunit E